MTRTRYVVRTFDLMAIGITLPEVSGEEHPNRLPFSGTLTLVDEPSDRPPNGAHGHRVIIPRAVAEKALPTLIGMAVDVVPELTDHNAARKVGLITQASIQGNQLNVSGYLYAKDFPKEVAAIQQRKDELGMSYEITDVDVQDAAAPIWTLSHLAFTGGAILFKQNAAYQHTSLQARQEMHEMEEETMAIRTATHTKLDRLLDRLDAAGKREDEEDEDARGRKREDEEDEDARGRKREDEEDEDARGRKREDDEEGRGKKDDEDAMVRAMLRGMHRMKGRRARAMHDDEAEDKAMLQKMLDHLKEADEDDEEAIGAMLRTMLRGKRRVKGRAAWSDPRKKKNLLAALAAAMRKDEEDEGEDVEAAVQTLLRAMRKDEDEEEAAGARIDKLEAAFGLLTDAVTKLGALVTDKTADTGKLKTDENGNNDADRGMNARGNGLPKRRTFSAAQEASYLTKYGVEDGRAYRVAEIDEVLKRHNVTDPTVRIAIKHDLESRGQLTD